MNEDQPAAEPHKQMTHTVECTTGQLHIDVLKRPSDGEVMIVLRFDEQAGRQLARFDQDKTPGLLAALAEACRDAHRLQNE